jgi:hypothetical protein
MSIVAALAAQAFAGEASASSSPAPLRSATNLCTHSLLYSFLPDDNLPVPAKLEASNMGERFEIVAGPRYTLEGHAYFETTIPVSAGTGTGAHYWVSDRCFVIAPESGRH